MSVNKAGKFFEGLQYFDVPVRKYAVQVKSKNIVMRNITIFIVTLPFKQTNCILVPWWSLRIIEACLVSRAWCSCRQLKQQRCEPGLRHTSREPICLCKALGSIFSPTKPNEEVNITFSICGAVFPQLFCKHGYTNGCIIGSHFII